MNNSFLSSHCSTRNLFLCYKPVVPNVLWPNPVCAPNAGGAAVVGVLNEKFPNAAEIISNPPIILYITQKKQQFNITKLEGDSQKCLH